jgi:hypothetical protein
MAITTQGLLTGVAISEVGVTNGLVGWWPLGDDSQDHTEYRSDTVAHNTTVTTGKEDLAYLFDGSTSYLARTCTPGDALDITGNITMSAWVKYTGDTALQYIISKSLGGGITEQQYALALSDNKLYLIRNGAYVNDCELPSSTWVHVVGTVTSSAFKVYLNGVECQSSTLTAPSYSTVASNFSIGRSLEDESIAFYAGSLQDVRVYNRGLSAAEVKILYSSKATAKLQLTSSTVYLAGELYEAL